MGFDTTPSADKRIFVLGVVTCVSLVAAMPLFRSYFYSVLDPHEAALVEEAGHPQLDAYRAEQERALGDVGASIQQLGERGRVAGATVAPRQGDRASIAAVGGWTLLPDEAGQHAAEHAYDLAEARRLAAEAAANPDGGVPTLEAPAPTAPVPTAPAPAPSPAPENH